MFLGFTKFRFSQFYYDFIDFYFFASSTEVS